MAFEATKREWSEIYAFYNLLYEGKIALDTHDSKMD